jgi:hypothetical protein
MPLEREHTPPHISIHGDDVEGHDTPKSARSSSGWDGKLRIEKKLELANPEALSDPEYSDEENVVPGEVIDADEGIYTHAQHHPISYARLTILRPPRRLSARHPRNRLCTCPYILYPFLAIRPIQSRNPSLSSTEHHHRDRKLGMPSQYTHRVGPLR